MKILSNINNRAAKTLTAQKKKKSPQTCQLLSSKYTKNEYGIRNSTWGVERGRKKEKGRLTQLLDLCLWVLTAK